MNIALMTARQWMLALCCSLVATLSPVSAANKAPEFTHASSAEWLNSKPLRLKNLRGKVVLIEFWAFDCVNCRRTVPWVHSLQERFGDRLVIVGVHTPELPEERVTQNVVAAVQSQKIEYPVMLDADYSYWQALDNKYWPAFYVVDKRGRIAAEAIGEMHVGQPRAADFERKIESLVNENPPGDFSTMY
jgi:thiol-disulfide isomerase/thioredoxin